MEVYLEWVGVGGHFLWMGGSDSGWVKVYFGQVGVGGGEWDEWG